VADESYPQIDRFARSYIRKKARQVVGRAGFTEQDREDLEQELVLRLLQRLPSRDPRRGRSTTFTRLVVDHAVANMLRERGAEKRGTGRNISLSEPVELPGGRHTELAQVIGQRERDARLGRQSRPAEEGVDLVLDVADLLAKLPAPQRELAERLKSSTIAEVARDLGLPRTTVASRVRALRCRFEQAGLREYL
jgi:RNA polymerase sigma-70 factor (ECF subfamily)